MLQFNEQLATTNIWTPSEFPAASMSRWQHFSWTNAAPAFALEPPALVEYSNSTGTVIPCKAFFGQQQQQQKVAAAGSHAHLAAATPISVSWRVIRTGRADNEGDDDGDSGEQVTGTIEQVLNSAAGNNNNNQQQRSRFVRADGALVVQPFAANEYQKDVHSAVYRCCLANKFGSLCSRPVRTLAGEFGGG